MPRWLRFTQGVLSLWLSVGCSLLAPSKDEISGGEGGGGTVSGGGSGGNAGANGGNAGSGGSAAGDLIFSDEFDTSKPEWQFAGESGWTLENGEALQSSASATTAVRWVPTLANLTDYRIEVRARKTSLSPGAIQVLFRQTANSRFYYCSFHPSLGEMYWGVYSDGFDTVEVGPAPTFSVDYDPNQPFTITLVVVGNHFTCGVAEVPAANTSLDDNTYPTGGPGLKTFELPVAYDYIRVYSK